MEKRLAEQSGLGECVRERTGGGSTYPATHGVTSAKGVKGATLSTRVPAKRTRVEPAGDTYEVRGIKACVKQWCVSDAW